MRCSIRLGAITLFTLASCALGIAAPPAQTPCNAAGAPKPTAQERIAQRDIQEAIDRGVEEWQAFDLVAVSREMPLISRFVCSTAPSSIATR